MKLIYRLILICFLIYCASFLLYSILAKGLRKYEVHKTERFQQILVDSNYHDILFLGSSKMHTGVNPSIIDSICQSNSYNAAIEGSNLLESYYIFKAYLENHRAPSFVFLSTDLFSFDTRHKFFNFTIYLNYLNNHVINNMLNENGIPTLKYKICPFLIFSELDDYSKSNTLKGFAGKTEIPAGDFQYKGFLSNTGTIIEKDTTDLIRASDSITITSDAEKMLSEIISICKEKNIKLTFIYSPEFKSGFQKKYISTEKFFQFMDSVSQKNAISFLRHDTLSICNNPEFFANIGHLNRPGAAVYSLILGEQIKNMILSKN